MSRKADIIRNALESGCVRQAIWACPFPIHRREGTIRCCKPPQLVHVRGAKNCPDIKLCGPLMRAAERTDDNLILLMEVTQLMKEYTR